MHYYSNKEKNRSTGRKDWTKARLKPNRAKTSMAVLPCLTSKASDSEY